MGDCGRKNWGSSPLARGLPSHARILPHGRGIIPARAGFTLPVHINGVGGRDHPRSRGVYSTGRLIRWAPRGSSPLARGLHRRLLQQGRHRGIIPARAGFTPRQGLGPGRREDHPRSRGVYAAWSWRTSRPRGSSPLARGLQFGSGRGRVARRIIPARAGFTPTPTPTTRAGRDHPRSRGVYAEVVSEVFPRRGSSPLARGLPPGLSRTGRLMGIIPARAGFTPAGCPPAGAMRDHPRSRGVYTCGSLVSQRTRSLPDPRRLHCRPRARSAGSP